MSYDTSKDKTGLYIHKKSLKFMGNVVELVKSIFTKDTQPKIDLKELLNNGALLLDVRTRSEYSTGHVNGSKNIPLDELGKSLSKLDKGQNIVVVCASGMRSAQAVNMMKQNGFINCYNGGSWLNFR